jgi:hypothetical protein
LNDFLCISNKFAINAFSRQLNILYIIFNDLTLFNEKKTNYGLFNIMDSLNLHIFFSGANITHSYIFLKNLKIKTNNHGNFT